jgi:hypothetical protein
MKKYMNKGLEREKGEDRISSKIVKRIKTNLVQIGIYTSDRYTNNLYLESMPCLNSW